MYQVRYNQYPGEKTSGYFQLNNWQEANQQIPKIMQIYDIEWYEAVIIYYKEVEKWKGYFSL